LACAGVANAAELPLSTHSSDDTPAAWLSATFEFTVTGSVSSGGQTLTLEVTNETGISTPAFAINQVFFNSAAGVSLSQVGANGLNGWALDQSGTAHAGGFGRFDFALLAAPQGGSPDAIAADSSLTFVFAIDHDSDVTAGDFVTEFSTVPPGAHEAIIAAKFIQGPGDDSAYGAYIPLPPALPMGIAGLVGVAALRRWKRAKIINPG
jgi:hypothetical protein